MQGDESAMKKCCASIIIMIFPFAFCLFLFLYPAQAAPLPDVLDEWHAAPTATTELRAASEDLGRWRNRIYARAAPIARIEVNFMEGSGPGTLRVPEVRALQNDAPLGFVSTYRTLNISGKRAILERGEVTGQALAVAFDKNRTLTIETRSVSEEELLHFAERLIHALEQED